MCRCRRDRSGNDHDVNDDSLASKTNAVVININNNNKMTANIKVSTIDNEIKRTIAAAADAAIDGETVVHSRIVLAVLLLY